MSISIPKISRIRDLKEFMNLNEDIIQAVERINIELDKLDSATQEVTVISEGNITDHENQYNHDNIHALLDEDDLISNSETRGATQQSIKAYVDNKVKTFTSPNSITVNTGGTPVGAISDIQTLLDGNVYQLPEVAGTPGFDVEFVFTGITDVKGFAFRAYYAPLTSSHLVTFAAWNYDTSAWDQFMELPPSTGYNYRYIEIPNGNSPYFDGSGNAKIRFYHNSSGNAAHDLYVDFIALIS